MSKSKACKHKWGEPTTKTGSTVTVECLKCSIKKERPIDPAKYAEYDKKSKKSLEEMHGPVMAMNQLMVAYAKADPWKRIEAAESLAEEYPDKIQVFGCDDSCHTGSRIFAIDVTSKLEGTHGTWLFFFPQCSGEPVARMFFYSEAMKAFLAGLRALHTKQNKTPYRPLPWNF